MSMKLRVRGMSPDLNLPLVDGRLQQRVVAVSSSRPRVSHLCSIFLGSSPIRESRHPVRQHSAPRRPTRA